ncbi:hypothetical protein SH2C18_17150 [Clostridium sediminicola]|uniref:response regulator n=1 Tax=Clostridium sediminicola TaxID=3114879 RepID=UPI0031F2180A
MAKILIVDDSTVMRKNLYSIFTKNGHDVVGEAKDGVQALALHQELKPDLITMDITMPKMNGVEAVKKIINNDKNAMIVIISALNQKQMVFQALNNGAKHYVTKPIEPSKLLGVINEVLDDSMFVDEIKLNKKEESLETKNGFVIENINGKFIVKFNEYLNNKNLNQLHLAIKGLLFIKPLYVTFDFEKANEIPKDIMDNINELSNSILEAGGFVEISQI